MVRVPSYRIDVTTEIDLVEAALLIARGADPTLDSGRCQDELAALAARGG